MATILDRFRCRRGTAAALAAANEIPLDSEIVLESDTGLGKIGDGVTHYNSLLYRIMDGMDLTGLAAGKVLVRDPTNAKWIVGDGGAGSVTDVMAGTNVSIDKTDPTKPIVSSTIGTITLKDSVAAYSNLPTSPTPSGGDAYYVRADGLVYIYASGVGWPAQGTGVAPWAPQGTVPLAASFTTLSASAFTVADKLGRMQIVVPSVAVRPRCLLRTLPAPPYTIDLCGTMADTYPGASDACSFSLALSDGAKIISAGAAVFQNGSFFSCDRWTNTTTYNANALREGAPFSFTAIALRMTDDGTTRRFYISQNRKDYMLEYSEPNTTFLTATKGGIEVYNNSNRGMDAKFTVTHFAITSSVLGDAP